jgi:hypothetical protein
MSRFRANRTVVGSRRFVEESPEIQVCAAAGMRKDIMQFLLAGGMHYAGTRAIGRIVFQRHRD